MAEKETGAAARASGEPRNVDQARALIGSESAHSRPTPQVQRFLAKLRVEIACARLAINDLELIGLLVRDGCISLDMAERWRAEVWE